MVTPQLVTPQLVTPQPEEPLRLQILGPLRLWRGGTELGTGPRQQACLLAALLARVGTPVSSAELVRVIWDDDAPPSARNILHKYVGSLRRLLQPSVQARQSGSYLIRRGDFYQLTVGPRVADVVAFRELVAAGRAHRDGGRAADAFDHYARALAMWRGPAGDGLTHSSWATAVFVSLDGELLTACVEAARLAVTGPHPDRVLPALLLAASVSPLHEGVQAGLVRVLAAAGRQAEALAAFAAVRDRLAGELGIDPGPELVAAHRWVLNRPAARPARGVPRAAGVAGVAGAAPTEDPATVPTTPALRMFLPHEAADDDRPGVRTDENRLLRRALGRTLAGGAVPVVVEGDPGSGKTWLLRELTVLAREREAGVLEIRRAEEDSPPLWSWRRALAATAFPMPEASPSFQLRERVATSVRELADGRPQVIVVDDLHHADDESLCLLEHLVADLPARVMLAVGLRDRSPVPSARTARTLARLSRLPGHRRITLGPLDAGQAGRLVHHECGRPAPPEAVARIRARSAGNPFLTAELVRSITGPLTVEAVTHAPVPPVVRDVIRSRTDDLAPNARHLLETASLLGDPIGLLLLARAADLRPASCLDLLEPLMNAGLLELVPGEAPAVRFPHDLVRECVAGLVPPGRAGRIHLRAAEALHDLPPHERTTERFAHHRWAAGALAGPSHPRSLPERVSG